MERTRLWSGASPQFSRWSRGFLAQGDCIHVSASRVRICRGFGLERKPGDHVVRSALQVPADATVPLEVDAELWCSAGPQQADAELRRPVCPQQADAELRRPVCPQQADAE